MWCQLLFCYYWPFQKLRKIFTFPRRQDTPLNVNAWCLLLEHRSVFCNSCVRVRRCEKDGSQRSHWKRLKCVEDAGKAARGFYWRSVCKCSRQTRYLWREELLQNLWWIIQVSRHWSVCKYLNQFICVTFIIVSCGLYSICYVGSFIQGKVKQNFHDHEINSNI